ncbi:M23 family metallopeptidase [Flavobacteriales bacterium AH-315-E23]|nr:M23 family metallopeptidase [Flavobacteriales bacterium AH-315-E23]
MDSMLRNILVGIFTVSLLGAPGISNAQDEYPKDYFRSPLDIPLKLAGNFGEIRPNHFHGGIDIKTESVEGKNVYAAAGGYVSRIKVSPWGYGKTLYITHPNGYITVYAHLKRYSDKIETYIKKYQYRKEAYSVEKFPLRGELKVEKGEVIAYGGNTGGSSGPHLHFEIRNAITGYVINPLLFGFSIMDSIKPVIRAVRVYPLSKESHVGNSRKPQYVKIKGTSGNYRTSADDPVVLQGKIGFAVEVYDFLNYSHNKCGIYSIELQKDGKRVYYHEMETYGFHETRYISSHVDYMEFKDNGKHLQKSFIAPNNQLSIYKETLNRGVVLINDDKAHEMKYIIRDSYGNTSTLTIPVQGSVYTEQKSDPLKEGTQSPKDKNAINKVTKDSGGSEPNIPESMDVNQTLSKDENSANSIKKFPCQLSNSFENQGVKVFLDAGLLYEDLDFEYRRSDTIIGAIAPTHHIHNVYTPVHKYFSISIRTDKIPSRLKEKAMIARVKENGRTYYEGGSYYGDFITTKSKYFGLFTVLLDTIPPRIRGLNIYEGKNMTKARSITVSVYDKLSGIAKYDAYLDGKWILMEYEPKKAALNFSFDDLDKYTDKLKSEDGKKSTHTFKIIVTDNRGNSSQMSIDFIR